MLRPRNTSPLALLVVAVVAAFAGCPAIAQDEQAAALEAVRERLEALNERVEQASAERDDGARQLQRIEEQVAERAAELERIAGQLTAEEARLEELEREAGQARERIGAERGALAESVRLSYLLGREERLRLMLSQEEPAELGRMLGYYGYLSRARGQRIGRVVGELDELERLAAASSDARDRLARLQAQQSAELERLEEARDERSALLTRLEREVASSGNEIESLREEEARLEALMAEVAALAETFPANLEEPISGLKGRLPWPVDGTVADAYGSGSGPVRSEGIVIEAPRGTIVRSIHHGQVVFAGWLFGHGLSLIINHGEGYMSVFGRNEVLLKAEGDWVVPGEAIAHVGETGGQRRPSLYFEMRRELQTFDPVPWMRARQ